MKPTMPYLYLLALRDEVAEAFRQSFSDVEQAEIVQEDFAHFMDTHPHVDGIVSPANSFGMMTGGLDRALRDYFGRELQDAVRDIILADHFGEQAVGTSIAVDIPGHPGKKLMHTPTMRTPSVILDYQTVYLCMRSALTAAIRAGVQYLMVPAFGGSTGQVPETVIAHNMRVAYDQIKDQLESPRRETFKSAGKRNIIRSNET